jgi:hypothetical protein
VANSVVKPRLRAAARAGVVMAALGVTLLASGCSTGSPRPLGGAALAEAASFPYFPVYWAGPRFEQWPLAAADGTRSYLSNIGDSVYYGNCVSGKGLLAGGNCLLPLQVTTVIYGIHSNATLGPQENRLLRGVPATIYDEGRSIELYSGRVAIDIFSDQLSHALAAVQALYPINAPGSASAPLPLPVYCPGLSGPEPADVRAVMLHLPRRACQEDEAEVAYTKRVKGE